MAESRSSVNAPMVVAGVDDLEGVQRRGQRGHYFGRGHGQGDGAGLQDWMAAGKKLFGVDVGDGAGGSDLQVAAHQLRADRRTGHDSWLWRRLRA